MSEKHIAYKTYLKVFGALIVLALLTTGIAFVDMGHFNTVVAMTIAIIKAVLVLLFFMHLRYSGHLTWVFVAAGIYWLFIMFLLLFSDYISRAWIPQALPL